MSKILLVDDDEQLGDMIEKMLAGAGLDVLRARNGQEALRLFDSQTVELVLTDLVMPDMDGVELIIELNRLYPGLKIIAMSGGGRSSAEDYLKPTRHLGATLTLPKPFSGKQLMTAIHEVLIGDAPVSVPIAIIG